MENTANPGPTKKSADVPAIRGPFRGLVITFPKDKNLKEFIEIYSSITFEHPNFYYSKSDKYKCIIYYKYPYDVATLVSKYGSTTNLDFSIYYDELTKTLQPNVLYVVTKNVNMLLAKVEQLRGTIIYKSRIGFQIKFEDFKAAAIAHEELRKDFTAKFAYRSEVNKYSNPRKITKTDEEKYQLKSDIKLLIQKYKRNSENPAFKEELSDLHRRQNDLNQRRIRQAAENLDFANISWNKAVDKEEEEGEAEKEEEESKNILEKLQELYRNL